MAMSTAATSPKAKAELDTAVKLLPEDALAHNNLGVWYELQGDAAAAKNEYSLAVQYAPGNIQAKENLARVVAQK